MIKMPIREDNSSFCSKKIYYETITYERSLIDTKEALGKFSHLHQSK